MVQKLEVFRDESIQRADVINKLSEDFIYFILLAAEIKLHICSGHVE